MTSERQRLELKAFREEQQKIEAEEKERREKPVREAEAAFKATADDFARVTKAMIVGGKDVNFELPASVAGRTMSVADARVFNANEAERFISESPEYHRCDENYQAIINYFQRNGVNIADAQTFRKAYERLREYGLLLERPEPEAEQEQEQRLELERRVTPDPTEPDLYTGVDPSTGITRTYTSREVDRMSSLDFRKAFSLYGDSTPRLFDARP